MTDERELVARAAAAMSAASLNRLAAAIGQIDDPRGQELSGLIMGRKSLSRVDLAMAVAEAYMKLDKPGVAHAVKHVWMDTDDPQRPKPLLKVVDTERDEDGGDIIHVQPVNFANNEQFRILGLYGTQVAFRIAAGQLLYRSREQLSQIRTLNALAPDPNWWVRVNGGEPVTSRAALNIGAALIREADKLGPVDISKVVGRGAVRVDDKVFYHLGDRLVRGADVYQFEQLPQRVWVAEPSVPMAGRASKQERQQLARAVMEYRWKHPDDGRRMLGWIVAALVGGALEWRPHLLFTAPASTGKSWILRNVVQKIMGPLALKIADATPAALARLTAISTLPIIIDEAEPSHAWVPEVLAQMRISSGGEGFRVRADVQTGGVTTQMPRYSALLAGTAAPKLNKADSTRLSRVRLGPRVVNWPKVQRAIRAAVHNADGIRAAIVQDAEWIADTAAKCADFFQAQGDDSRESLTAGALTAGWRWWGVDNREVRNETSSVATDASDALFDVLALRVRAHTGEQEQSLLKMIAEEAASSKHAAVANDLYGVRVCPEGLLVDPKHRGLLKAMERTVWGQVDLRYLLLQLREAQWTSNPRSIGGRRARAVIIPLETLTELGVTVREWQEPGQEPPPQEPPPRQEELPPPY